MNTRKQNIAIAEALGAKWYYCSEADKKYQKRFLLEPGCFVSLPLAPAPMSMKIANKNEIFWEMLTDYTADLDAMMRAEKTLTPEQLKEYSALLGHNVSATASERAEKFLMVIRKWKN